MFWDLVTYTKGSQIGDDDRTSLEFPVLESTPFVFDSSVHTLTEDTSNSKQYSDQHHFLNYSANNWLLHVRDAADKNDGKLLDRFCTLCDNNKEGSEFRLN